MEGLSLETWGERNKEEREEGEWSVKRKTGEPKERDKVGDRQKTEERDGG